MKIKFKRLHPAAQIPAFGHDDLMNAGLDLFLIEDTIILRDTDARLKTGVAWEPVDLGLGIVAWKPALFMRPRSSTISRGLLVVEGTIDWGYRGEILINVRNICGKNVVLKAGDRIAQVVPILIPTVEVMEAQELSETARGERGFGSSGA